MYPALTPRDFKYGAPLGHDAYTPDEGTVIKLHLRKLRWVDYDYVEDGTYYGYVRGTNIYRAVGHGTEELNEMFVRAINREDAKRQVLEVFTKAKFYR